MLEITSKMAGLLRCGKSFRLRWINYLRPDLKRGNFTEEDDEMIIKLHSLLGNKWSLIAGRLPGRIDNEIKNYWNTHIRKKLQSKSIDPTNQGLAQETAIVSAEINDQRNNINAEDGRDMDLNLDLQISPPCGGSEQLNLCRGSIVPCFFCRLGLENSKECNCNSDGSNSNNEVLN